MEEGSEARLVLLSHEAHIPVYAKSRAMTSLTEKQDGQDGQKIPRIPRERQRTRCDGYPP